MYDSSKRVFAALAFAVAGAAVIPVSADTTSIYTGPTNGQYTTPGNWNPPGVPNGSTFAVIIGDSTDPNVLVNLNAPVTVDTLTIDAGSTLFLQNGAILTANTITTVGTGQLETGGGNFTGEITGNTTIATGSTINITDNSGIDFAAGFTYTNNGTINISSGGNQSRILLTGAGTTSFAGTGSIVFGTNTTQNYIASDTLGATLDNGASHTITGSGQFTQDPGGTHAYNITNEGTITALNGSMYFNQLGNVTNTGTIRAGNGIGTGLLNLENDAINNVGGLILATNGSAVQLFNGISIVGGTLQTTGTGVIQVISGNFAPQLSGNVTFAAGSNVTVQDNSGLSFATGSTYTNNGTITLSSAGNATRLQLTGGGTATFAGSGSIVFGTNTLQNYIVSDTAGAILDNTVTHTIVGTGQFTQDPGGARVYDIHNEGFITALSGTMLFNQQGNVTNTGTIRAGNGTGTGLLELRIDAFNNVGGLIVATNNSTIQLDNGVSIAGGTLQSIGAGLIQTASANFTPQLSGAISFPAGTQVRILDNSGISFAGGFTYTNNGTITLLSAGNATRILMTGGGTTTFAGNGTISFATNTLANYIVSDTAGAILDNTANHTISGAGQFTQDPGGTHIYDIHNEGHITALAGTMQINTFGNLTNTNAITAGDGVTAATLNLANVDITNTGGTILANANGTIVLINGVSIANGTLRSIGTGSFTVAGANFSPLFSGNITFASGTNLNINDNTGVIFAANGTYTNNGTISLFSAGNSTRFGMNGTGTVAFAGNGTINLATNSTANEIVAYNLGLTLDNGANHTITGAGQFTQDIGGTQLYNITNEGAITALNGPLNFNQFGNVTNTGTIRAGDGTATGTVNLENDTYLNAGGKILANAGSVVQLFNGSSIVGGTLQSLGNGSINSVGGQFNPQLSGNITFPAGTHLNIIDNSGLIFAANGTYTNNGTITFTSAGNADQIALNGNGIVTFNGNGSIVLGSNSQSNRIVALSGFTITLDNAANHTISGIGQFTNAPGGTVSYTLTNEGTINANAGGQLLVAPGISTANTGTFEATAGGTLNVQGVFVQDTTGTLTAGTYLVNDVSLLTLANSPNITTIASPATVILTGPNSSFPQIDNTPSSGSPAGATGTVTSNAGDFVLFNRAYTVAAAFSNDGTTQLGGATFTAPTFTNNAPGLLIGNGSVVTTATNAGHIEADGGTLAFSTGVTGTTGTLQSDAGGTLSLSQGSQTSTTGTLNNNGNLTLGANNVTAALAYTNAAFGVGNTFNKHANVATTGGLILAAGNNTQSITGTGVSNGTTTTPTLAFGNVHVTTAPTLNYQIANNGSGPSILFASQTTVNGASLTDPRLSGTGVTAGNVGPIAAGSASGNRGVTFNAATDGPLTGQKIHIANNFDNSTTGTLAEQTLAITGTAYNYAAPVLANSTVSFGNFHVSASPTSAGYSIKNNAPNDGFSEKLDVTTSGASGTITLAGGISLLAPQSTDNTSITAAFTPNSAGAKSGTATLTFISDGTGTSGLGNTTISNTTVTATANVFRLAAPSAATPNPVVFGNHHVGDSVAPIGVSVTNTATSDGFSEKLDGTLANTTSSGITFSGNYSLVGPQLSVATVLATLDTSTPGNKSGSATVNFVSDGTGTSGLGNTPLTGQSQNLIANTTVFRLASPGTVTNINLGTIHVNDSGTAAVTVSNTAPNDGFSENLDATLSAPITGPVSASNNTITITPGGSNSTALTLTLDTSVAGIGRTGSATLHYVSNGTGSSGLGNTALNNTTVSITANVLNFATAVFQKDSGNGTLTVTGDHAYTLNFGNITQGSSVSALLGVLNGATAPSDTLAGTFTIGSGGFTTSGFNPFSGITAGSEDSGLSVSFSNTTTGLYSETITLAPRSQDASFDGALANITLTLNVNVVPAATPEPASLGLLGLGAAALLTRRKKHSR